MKVSKDGKLNVRLKLIIHRTRKIFHLLIYSLVLMIAGCYAGGKTDRPLEFRASDVSEQIFFAANTLYDEEEYSTVRDLFRKYLDVQTGKGNSFNIQKLQLAEISCDSTQVSMNTVLAEYLVWGFWEEDVARIRLADVERQLGNYDEALEILEEAEKAYDYRRTRSKRTTLRDYEAIRMGAGEIRGEISMARGELRDAYRMLNRALSFYSNRGNTISEARVRARLARLAILASQPDVALVEIQRALDVHEQEELGFTASLPAGGWFMSIGRNVRVNYDLSNRLSKGDDLAIRGSAYLAKGEFSKAVADLEHSVRIFEELGLKGRAANNKRRLALFFVEVKQYKEAQRLMLEATTVHDGLGMPMAKAQDFWAQGLLANRQDKHEVALKHFDNAYQIAKPLGLTSLLAQIQFTLGRTYSSQGKRENALRAFEESYRLFRVAEAPAQARPLIGYSEELLAIGKVTEAAERIEQALIILSRHGATAEDLWWGYYVAGEVARRQKNLGRARELLKRSVDAVETARSSLNVDAYKTGFFDSKLDAYDRLILVESDSGAYDEALKYSEMARARSLLDLWASRTEEPEDFMDQSDKLPGKAITSGFLAMDISPGDDRLISVHRGVTGVVEVAPQSNMQIQHISSPLSFDVDISDVKASIPPNGSLIEYYVRPDEVICWVLSSQEIIQLRLQVSKRELYTLVNEFRQEVGRANTQESIRAAHNLYERLFKPVKEHLKGKIIGVSPHDILNYVPFAALHDGEEYLLHKYAFFYVPSLSILKTIRRSSFSDSQGDVHCFGTNRGVAGLPPLRYAETEVQEVGATLKNAWVYVGGEATESRFQRIARNASVIHFACHAVLNKQSPMSSFLLLEGDSASDGFLQAQEVAVQRLCADVVVLSACQTALGELTNGNELIGLTRAFLGAGASSVIATLWSVDDKTSMLLMKSFYENYTSEVFSKALALQRAQLHILRINPNVLQSFEDSNSNTLDQEHSTDTPGLSPYFWAPFCIYGDWQ